ncbi:MAG: hypothetical protein JWM53_1846 [bacterium]|nr:hypothetical protein [bacterium]
MSACASMRASPAAFNKGERAALLAYHEQSFPYRVASA